MSGGVLKEVITIHIKGTSIIKLRTKAIAVIIFMVSVFFILVTYYPSASEFELY